MQLGNSMQCRVDAAGQLNSMLLCGLDLKPMAFVCAGYSVGREE